MDLVKVDTINKPFSGMSNLPIVRQAGLLIGLAASIAIGIYAVLWSQTGGYVPIATELGPRENAKIISILQTSGIEYRLDQISGNVLVIGSKLQNAKLKLAAEGITNNANVGYELLEQDQGFSSSQFMENVRYQRALSGELSRTISSMASIKSARVHLAIPKYSSFIRTKRQASASVFVDLFSGRKLNDGQVSSIISLVAMSIPNMSNSDVVVIDNRGRLLSSSKTENGIDLSHSQLKYTRQIESDYANRIEELLIPIVGLGKIKAQVVASIDFDKIEKTREEFDSEQPSVRSERKLEEQSLGDNAAIGIPGALSNQPPGKALEKSKNAKSDKNSQPSRNSRQSTVNYELNKTISHTKYSVAKIRRLTVAVVIDNKLELIAQAPNPAVKNPDAKNKAKTKPKPIVKVLTSVPRSIQEIENFTVLVKDAIGYNELRGDRVNIINAAFAKPEKIEPLPELSLLEQEWIYDFAKQALGVIFVLILVFGILRPVMKKLATFQPIVEVPKEVEDEVEDDQVTLSEETSEKLLQSQQSNLAIAKSMVSTDPKLVAQVVKNWVANE